MFLFLLKALIVGTRQNRLGDRLWLESPRRGGSNVYPQSMLWAEIWKVSIRIFVWKSYFWVVKVPVYLNRLVFVMHRQIAQKFTTYPDRSTQVVHIARQQYDVCTAVSWVARCSQLFKLKSIKRKAHARWPFSFRAKPACRKAVVRIRKTSLRQPYNTPGSRPYSLRCLCKGKHHQPSHFHHSIARLGAHWVLLFWELYLGLFLGLLGLHRFLNNNICRGLLLWFMICRHDKI